MYKPFLDIDAVRDPALSFGFFHFTTSNTMARYMVELRLDPKPVQASNGPYSVVW